MNVAILDDYADVVRTLACYPKLAGHDLTIWNDPTNDPGVLSERLKDTEALILLRERTPIPAALIERLPRLGLITCNGPAPHVDAAACTRRGVLLCCNLHSRPSYATAELTWGLIIAALRHIPQEVRRLRDGAWQRTVGTGLHGRTLGVFGYGRIGRQVAGYGNAFGMRVLVWAREPARERARAEGHGTAESKAGLFAQADVLSVHLRLVPETRGIVTAADLARMKPTALFVNTSRSGLVENDVLVAALRAGRPGRAAVDVYEQEPITAAAHPLLAMDNVVCTPHIGYVERDQLEMYYSDQFDMVLAYARGNPVNVINPEALAASRTTAPRGGC